MVADCLNPSQGRNLDIHTPSKFNRKRFSSGRRRTLISDMAEYLVRPNPVYERNIALMKRWAAEGK